MELYQLKTFVKVADTGNLTRASEALFTSQPAISAQIKALEDELGVELFSRTPKGMLLTSAGKHLYEHAQQALLAAERVKQEAQSLRNEIHAEIKVGIHTDFDFMMTRQLYQALYADYPQITLHFLQTASAKVIQQLRDGELDAGFMFGPCKAADVAVTTLSEVPLCIVGPSSWEDRMKDASLEELYQQSWIYTSSNCPFFVLFEQIFGNFPGKPERLVWADTENAIRELIKAEAGISLLRMDDGQRLAEDGFAYIWPQPIPGMHLNYVCLKQRQHEAALQAFADCVQSNWNLPEPCQQAIAG